MAALASILKTAITSFSKRPTSTQQLCNITNHLSALRLSSCSSSVTILSHQPWHTSPVSSFHTTTCQKFHMTKSTNDLMEFFDRKEFWAESSVPTGRPYRIDELRIKSNQDIHKLWYVLLKERNMLLTMEAEFNRNNELFPNPERIAKVEESMENILEVVKERNDAVSLLETGKPADPGGAYVRDFLGRVVWRKFQEYGIPPHMNKVYRLCYPRGFKRLHLKYLPLWREKIAKHRWGRYHGELRHNQALVKKFPHLEGKLEVPKPEEPKIY
ncbi:unnamed protein product [Lymnaea stagnalis]|uniref:Large ribosomal subunit protein uL29m n=1 Tax=Lymnaea stagnalis TaxID=6523 RepID=A0AAV2HBP4_LYMST